MRALGAMRWAIALLVVLLSMVQKEALAQSAALMGTVLSDREGRMEGVLVSAKKDGSTITVTVVTNSKGEYSFPASRLESAPIHPDHPCGRLRTRRRAAMSTSRTATYRLRTSSLALRNRAPTKSPMLNGS